MAQNLFLRSTDYALLEAPKQCFDLEPTEAHGHYGLWVKVDVPIIGQAFGFGEKDIYDLLLVARFDDNELRALNRFPTHVHVFLPTEPGNRALIRPWRDMNNIGWACLYDQLETLA